MSALLAPAIDAKRYARLLSRALPRVIHSDEENERLIAELMKLDQRQDLSPEEQELAELLGALIEQYEDERYPIDPVGPHAMLKHLMESSGRTHKDVWRLFGSKGVASEVLNGKRPSASPRLGSSPPSSMFLPMCLFEPGVQSSPK